MSSELEAIRRGCYTPAKKLRVQPLLSYLPRASNYARLATAIAYSMVTPLEERLTSGWVIAKRASGLSPLQLQNVCVFYLVIPNKLEDYYLVEYELLHEQSATIFETYPLLKRLLLEELMRYV